MVTGQNKLIVKEMAKLCLLLSNYCKVKGRKLFQGVHDSVNAHLNKKILHPKSLDFLFKHVAWSVQKTSGSKLKCSLCK